MSAPALKGLAPLSRMLSPTEMRRVAASLEIDGRARRAARSVGTDRQERAAQLLLELVHGFGNTAALAEALRAVAETVDDRPAPPVLVWSGPQLPGDSVRTTQALVRLIDDAEESVLATTFSASLHGPFLTALRRAAERKLRITIVADVVKLGDVARALAQAIPRAITYGFHHSHEGGQGYQHSKMLVVDGRVSLVTSANLSNQAVDWNLEAGVLVEGPEFAGQISRRITDLIASGHLRSIK